jgi:hypothetical protein
VTATTETAKEMMWAACEAETQRVLNESVTWL